MTRLQQVSETDVTALRAGSSFETKTRSPHVGAPLHCAMKSVEDKCRLYQSKFIVIALRNILKNYMTFFVS